jgi:hypothetical protein
VAQDGTAPRLLERVLGVFWAALWLLVGLPLVVLVLIGAAGVVWWLLFAVLGV